MFKQAQKVIAGVAVLAAVAVGAAAVAGAASDKGGSSGSGSGSGSTAARQGGVPPGGHGPGEKLLTGDTADKVKKAAEDKVPGGTILRVETDSEGSPYEAHVRKSNGEQVVVKVNKAFEVTDVENGPGGPGRGPGGPGGSGTGAQAGPPATFSY